MMQKPLLFIVFACTIPLLSFGQGKKTAIVKGKLINQATKKPFNDLKVTMPELSAFTTSDGEGNFTISEVPFGRQVIIINAYNAKSDTLRIDVESEVVDLNDISITPNEKGVSSSQENGEIPTIVISDVDPSSGSDFGGGSNAAGGDELLIASKDPFVNVARSLSAYYFRPRGIRGTDAEINGIGIIPAISGSITWVQEFGDQTDIFRGTESRYGLEPSAYEFGAVNGSSYFSATAADFSQGTKVTYAASDHTWKNKVMYTTSTGVSKKGWAFAASANKRWAEQGYRPGTSFDGYAYYAGVSKVFKKGSLNLTTFGSPLKQARYLDNSTTQEDFNLAKNNYYNPTWGYQTVDGKQVVRNSDIQNVFQPTTILNYDYKPSEKTRWNTAVGYQFGTDRASSLDYYNAASPFGNYYRNMPSYYYTSVPPSIQTGNALTQQILNNPNLLQVNWDELYAANAINTQTIYNVNGVAGNNVTGKESSYVMADKVNDLKKLTFNSNVEHTVNEHLTIYGGLSAYTQTDHVYKQVTDLMGGDFFVNYNQFATQQTIPNPNYIQNNLNAPNAVIRNGDIYGYDLAIRLNEIKGWGQAIYTFDKFDFFAAVSTGNSSFSRDGYYKNGLFPNNSYGVSPTQNFFTYSAKAGVTYKISPKNFLFVNAAYLTAPPTVSNTYISVATRDMTVPDPTVQRTQSIEGGYLLKSSKINARVVGYINNVLDATEIKRFYNDDPAYNTFVNYIMQHENTRSIGTELMLDYRLTHAFNITGVAAIGESYYANRPDVSQVLDNDPNQQLVASKAYIQNYYLGNGPQSAYSAKLNYRGKNYWDANISFNYLTRNYVEINPNRRTEAAAGLVPQGSAQWHAIFDQEELPSFFTVDLHAGKTFQLSRLSDFVKKASGTNTTLYISMGISNLLNNTNIILRGREQLRYDFTYENPAKFPNTYLYGFGINYFLSMTLSF